MRAADLLGTETQSGSTPQEAGSLPELTRGGGRPIKPPSGETMLFFQGGDTIGVRGWAEDDQGRRIGLGERVDTIGAPA